ncbi:unnamed protein product [Caenorhabditis sp. 36 PRJEB53466]|nr:unnamed protein product [Caenorhabditis sp. 36 PRJEB53466]
MDPSASEGTKPMTPAEEVVKKVAEKKVTVSLQPVADAPILKNKKFKIGASTDIAKFSLTIRKLLNLPADKSLFFYISHTFAPSPDHTLELLSQCYAVKGGGEDILQLQYSTTPAWG